MARCTPPNERWKPMVKLHCLRCSKVLRAAEFLLCRVCLDKVRPSA